MTIETPFARRIMYGRSAAGAFAAARPSRTGPEHTAIGSLSPNSRVANSPIPAPTMCDARTSTPGCGAAGERSGAAALLCSGGTDDVITSNRSFVDSLESQQICRFTRMRFGSAGRFVGVKKGSALAAKCGAKPEVTVVDTKDIADRIRAVIDEASVRATVATSVELDRHISVATAEISEPRGAEAPGDGADPPHSPAPPAPKRVERLRASPGSAALRRRRAAAAAAAAASPSSPPSPPPPPSPPSLAAQHASDIRELGRFERSLDEKIAALEKMKRSVQRRALELRSAFDKEQSQSQSQSQSQAPPPPPPPQLRHASGRAASARGARASIASSDTSSIRRGTFFGSYPQRAGGGGGGSGGGRSGRRAVAARYAAQP